MANEGSTGSTILLAFLGGAAVGAAVALLTAPHSGAETRGIIKSAARKRQQQLKSLPPAVKDAYIAASTAAREAFEEAYESQLSDGS